MSSQDFIFYSLGVGFVSYAAFCLSKTLKRLNSILENTGGIIQDVDELKNYIKQGFQL